MLEPGLLPPSTDAVLLRFLNVEGGWAMKVIPGKGPRLFMCSGAATCDAVLARVEEREKPVLGREALMVLRSVRVQVRRGASDVHEGERARPTNRV